MKRNYSSPKFEELIFISPKDILTVSNDPDEGGDVIGGGVDNDITDGGDI